MNAQGPVHVYAAGSLRAVMLELGAVFEAAGGAKLEFIFGPLGVLRERIERGEAADVRSANLQAAPFVEFVLSRQGQEIIARHGFAPA